MLRRKHKEKVRTISDKNATIFNFILHCYLAAKEKESSDNDTEQATEKKEE